MKTWILVLFALACRRDRDVARGPRGAPDEAGPDGSHFVLSADTDSVPLPFATAGDAVPDGALTLIEAGGAPSDGGISLRLTGDFEVSGDPGPLAADEARPLTVSYVGPTGEARIATGALEVSVDGQQLTVDLAAVLGDPALPDADWTHDAYGWRTIVDLPSAPFPYGSAPYTDSSVLIFAPEQLADSGDLGVVTHLHGHNATLTEVVAAQYLVEQHALSGRDAALIVPQGPVEAADGDFGRLDTEGGHAALVRDAISVMYRDGRLTRPAVGAAALSSHSGGYLATANILQHGGLDIDAVHLFDSLYGQESVYEDFARAGGVLRSVYTASGGTDDNNRALRGALRDEGLTVCEGWDDDSLADCALTIAASDASHSGCVSEQRAYGRWLARSGLPRSPLAPPELLAVIAEGDRARVLFRRDPGAPGQTLRIETSADGAQWQTALEVEPSEAPGVGEAEVAASPWVRLRTVTAAWGPGQPSDTYGATGGDWLVVDGFDRALGGSYAQFTHDFGARLGAALGEGFSVTSNEALISGDVSLDDYKRVLWFLGDESSADAPLDAAEMALLEAWLDAGGQLVITGSELGYAGDRDWLSATLHATYVSDDAGSDTAGGYPFGVVYDEDYPDVWSGDETLLSYGSGGAAAVGWQGQIVVVGFGLETMEDAPLAQAMAELMGWLEP